MDRANELIFSGFMQEIKVHLTVKEKLTEPWPKRHRVTRV